MSVSYKGVSYKTMSTLDFRYDIMCKKRKYVAKALKIAQQNGPHFKI